MAMDTTSSRSNGSTGINPIPPHVQSPNCQFKLLQLLGKKLLPLGSDLYPRKRDHPGYLHAMHPIGTQSSPPRDPKNNSGRDCKPEAADPDKTKEQERIPRTPGTEDPNCSTFSTAATRFPSDVRFRKSHHQKKKKEAP